MTNPSSYSGWTRRRWLTQQGLLATAFALRSHRLRNGPASHARGGAHGKILSTAQLAARATRLDPVPWQALAQHAVDVAHAAGVQYVDARLTRVVVHRYNFRGGIGSADERVGIGVRALVGGYWGFSASAVVTHDEAVRLGQDAVAQARENAKGTPWTVELGHVPPAMGHWATPVRIDPFTISFEEKEDLFNYWYQCALVAGVDYVRDGTTSWACFVRHERVVATSEGALFTQTVYESGGALHCVLYNAQGGELARQDVHNVSMAGVGWERFLDAKIPEQYPQIKEELKQKGAILSKPAPIGQYPLVCDGATMAALVQETLGLATQLDRALGYEANAGGTSFIDDPLAQVGHLSVAAPMVTLTANRSTPMDLATIQWDDEGVAPQPFTLVKNGVLTDFQTTREQAAWLAPYYQRTGRPVQSHGCAAAEDAHGIPLQMMPNFVLEPSPAAIGVADMVSDITEGILVEDGTILQRDSQARTGVLTGTLRQIRNGRLGAYLQGGAILYNAPELWTHVRAVGGAATQQVCGYSRYLNDPDMLWFLLHGLLGKGEPLQRTSNSVRAVAATIAKQALINPLRKA
jgi:TldD protein